MAGSASDYLENKVADLLFGGTAYTPPATYYLACFTTAPNEAGSGGVEVSGGGYSRKAITNNKTNFSAASGGAVSNAVAIEMDASTGAQGTITHVALMDASSGGNMISGAIDLAASQAITASGQVLRFPVGSLVFTVS